MAAKKATAKAKASAVKGVKKSAQKTNGKAPAASNFQQRLSSTFAGIGLSKFKKPNQIKASKKAWIISGSAILVIILLILAATRLTIAWVDGRPISWFSYYSQLDGKYGPQLKDQLISQQLVLDEASKRGVSVSDTDVNNEINNIKSQSGGDSNFNQLLTQQGLTLDDLKTQVKLQLLIQKMFSQEASVSGQEIKSYISANKDQYPTDDASTEAQVKSQLEQQKLVNVFQSWLQSAEKSNRVVKSS